jgi:pimeloyl-ACP methyl ester carboxylesterase
MLVLGAANDVIVPPAEVERTAKAYDAPYAIFPSTGHDMMLDDQWERVADHIRRWLVGSVVQSPGAWSAVARDQADGTT